MKLISTIIVGAGIVAGPLLAADAAVPAAAEADSVKLTVVVAGGGG